MGLLLFGLVTRLFVFLSHTCSARFNSYHHLPYVIAFLLPILLHRPSESYKQLISVGPSREQCKSIPPDRFTLFFE